MSVKTNVLLVYSLYEVVEMSVLSTQHKYAQRFSMLTLCFYLWSKAENLDHIGHGDIS